MPINNDDLPDPERDLLGLPPALTPEEEAEAERQAKEKAEERKLLLLRLMNDPEFRTFLWEILVSFNTFETVFGAGPTGFPDPQATVYNLGLRAAGWHLWTLFDNAVPDHTSLMRREGTGAEELKIAPPPRKRKRRVVVPERDDEQP